MLTDSEMKQLNEKIAIVIRSFVDARRKHYDEYVAEMTEELPEFGEAAITKIDRAIYKAEVLNEFYSRIPQYIYTIYLQHHCLSFPKN